MVGLHMIPTSNFRVTQVRRVHDGIHLLGNHSFKHPHGSSNYSTSGMDNAEWLAEFTTCDQRIVDILDIDAQRFVHARLPGKNAWRLPGISRDDGNSQRVADHIHSNGYQIYGWDLEWGYSGSPEASDPVQSPLEVANAVTAALQNPEATELDRKVIILTHGHQFRNSRGNDVKLSRFIQILKDSELNIQFRLVDTYLSD